MSQAEHHRTHADMVRAMWDDVMDGNPAVRAWLEKVELVGYTEPQPIKPAMPGLIELIEVAA